MHPYLCELAVSERYVRRSALQGTDDIPQCTQALVDRLGLLHLLTHDLTAVNTLRTCKTGDVQGRSFNHILKGAMVS